MKACFGLLAAAAVLLGGCSAIVSLSDDDIRCTGTGEDDLCPDGRQCIDSYCQPVTDAGPCTPNDTPELCNNEDDDCDGMTDEGHDLDGDGVTWCGDGLLEASRDCDDSNPSVRPANMSTGAPAGTEECNGIDEDCNGLVDDGEVCPDGEMCISGGCFNPDDCRLPGKECDPGMSCNTALAVPSCVEGDCTDGGTGCPMGQTCDPATKACVTPGPLGAACTTNAECESAVCVPGAAAGPEANAPPNFCAQACCTDMDCPAASICWNSGTGAKLCIAETLLPAQSRGPGATWAPCSQESECASSICIAAGDMRRCLGNCSVSSECTGGANLACLPAELSWKTPPVDLNTCLPTAPGGRPGSLCIYDSDCEYGLCHVVGSGIGIRFVCGGACGTSSDCGHSELYCGFLSGTAVDAAVPGCRPKTHSGSAAGGANCTSSTECNDFACIEGRCLDSCCVDTDCSSGGTCRPYPVGGGSFRMRCSAGPAAPPS